MQNLIDFFANVHTAILVLAIFAAIPLGLLPLGLYINAKRRAKELPPIVIPLAAVPELIIGGLALIGVLYLVVTLVLTD